MTTGQDPSTASVAGGGGSVVHCHIPITITVRGVPDDAQLRELAERVRKQVARRIADADRAVAGHRAAARRPLRAAPPPVVGPDEAWLPGRGWRVLRAVTITISLGEFIDYWQEVVGRELPERVLFTDEETGQRHVTVWLVETSATTTLGELAAVVWRRAQTLLRLPDAARLLYAASTFDTSRQTLATLDPSGLIARLPSLRRHNARRVSGSGDDTKLLHGAWMLWAGMRLPNIDPGSWLDLGPLVQRNLPLADTAGCVDTTAFERTYGLRWSDYLAAVTHGVRVDLLALRVRRDLPVAIVRFLAVRAYGKQAGPPPGRDVELAADLFDPAATDAPTITVRFGVDFARDLPDLPTGTARPAHPAPGPRAAPGLIVVLVAVHLPVDAETLGAARFRPQAAGLATELRRLTAQVASDRYQMYRLYDWLGGTFDRPADARPPGGTLFEYVMAELSPDELNALFDTVEGTEWEGLERRLMLLCVPTRFAANPRVVALLRRLQAESWSRLTNTFHETTATDPGGIDLDRMPRLAVRIGGRDVLGDVDDLYITTADRKFLGPQAADRLRAAVEVARGELLDELATGRIGGELTGEDFARQSLARGGEKAHVTDGDFITRSVQRSLRITAVQRRDIAQMPSWDVSFRFVERLEGTTIWTDVSDTINETSDEFSARLIYWALGRAGEFYRAFGLTITVVGGIAVAWEAGLVTLLVDLAGGATAVLTSITISEVIYIIRVIFFDAKLSVEGFVMAAVDGYLGALGFRGATFVGAPLGRAFGQATLTRLWAGIVAEKLAVGTIGGGTSAAMSLFAHDAVDVMIHDGHFHTTADYARVVTMSAAVGVLAEFTVSPILHRLGGAGAAPRRQVADLIAQLRSEGYGVADFTAATTAALSRLRQALLAIMVDDAASAYLRAFRNRMAEIVTGWGPTVVARRVLELSGATMTRQAEAGLRVFLTAAEEPGSQEAARRLASVFAEHPQETVHLLEVLSTLDQSTARSLMTGTFEQPAELAAFLGRLSRYTADQQRGILGMLGELSEGSGLTTRSAGSGASPAQVRDAQAAAALAAEARQAATEAAALRRQAQSQLDEAVRRAEHNPRRSDALLERAAALEREAAAKERLSADLAAGQDPRPPGQRLPDLAGATDAEISADVDRVFAQLEAGGGTARQPWIRLPAHRGLTAPETDALTRAAFTSRSGNPVVFRVEGGAGTARSREFISIEGGGRVGIDTGGRDLNLNIGSFERAVEFMVAHRPGSTLKMFEVDAGWLRNLRGIATPEQGLPARVTAVDPAIGRVETLPSGGSLSDVRGTARTVDTRQATDQLQIDSDLLPELEEFIIPGSGRELIFSPRSPGGRSRQ